MNKLTIFPPDISDDSPQEYPDDVIYSISDFIIDLKESIKKWFKN